MTVWELKNAYTWWPALTNLFAFQFWDTWQKKDLQEFVPSGINDPEMVLQNQRLETEKH